MLRLLTVFIVSLAAVVIAGLGFYFLRSIVGGLRLPEIVLTILLIAGVIALLFALGGLLAVLRSFGLATPNEALGLPPGSVRAVLALMLVLVFAIMSVFLFYQIKAGGPPSRNIEQAQLDQLPSERIVAINRASPGPSGEPRFNVEMAASPASVDLAQQLVTLLGTLVTAIAAFYFGSASVTTAIKARDSDSGAPSTDPEVARAEAAAARAAAKSLTDKALRFDRFAEALDSTETPDSEAPAVPEALTVTKPDDPGVAAASDDTEAESK